MNTKNTRVNVGSRWLSKVTKQIYLVTFNAGLYVTVEIEGTQETLSLHRSNLLNSVYFEPYKPYTK